MSLRSYALAELIFLGLINQESNLLIMPWLSWDGVS